MCSTDGGLPVFHRPRRFFRCRRAAGGRRRGMVGGMDLPPAFDLRGRVALITGAGSPHGIGAATAELLGSLGAAVMLGATSDRVVRRVEELEARGVAAAGRVGDLTEEDAARDL